MGICQLTIPSTLPPNITFLKLTLGFTLHDTALLGNCITITNVVKASWSTAASSVITQLWFFSSCKLVWQNQIRRQKQTISPPPWLCPKKGLNCNCSMFSLPLFLLVSKSHFTHSACTSSCFHSLSSTQKQIPCTVLGLAIIKGFSQPSPGFRSEFLGRLGLEGLMFKQLISFFSED